MTSPTALPAHDGPPHEAPLQFLKGVGPERSNALRQLGLNTVQDLLFYLPRVHEDRRMVDDFRRVPPGAKAAVTGVVLPVDAGWSAAPGW
jgi:ATP-dependent DNA helicase RecG